MTDRLLCHALPCRAPSHIIGSFQTGFCPRHWYALTQNKRALVMTIQGFSVLELGSRARASKIMTSCRRYLLAHKEERKHANG